MEGIVEAQVVEGFHDHVSALEDNVEEGDDLGGTLTDLVKGLVLDVAAMKDDLVLIKQQMAMQSATPVSEVRGR